MFGYLIYIYLTVIQACRLSFPLQILVEAPSLQSHEAQHLVRATQHALDDLNEFPAHHLRLELAKTHQKRNSSQLLTQRIISTEEQHRDTHAGLVEDVALTVKMSPTSGTASPTALLRPHSTELEVQYTQSQVPSIPSSSSSLAKFLATQLQGLFAEEQATIAHILGSQSTGHQFLNGHPSTPQSQLSSTVCENRSGKRRSLPPELAARLPSRMTRSLKYAPTYHITLSLFTPSSAPSCWEIEAAIREYFEPLLDSISDISNFTVDTQVQLYASFSASVQQPEYDSERGVWTLREEDLSGFINAAEWPLSPSTGSGPTLNFVIYVPHQSNVPLVVQKSHATSWLIPQWGGVTILNPSKSSSESASYHHTLSKEAIQPALMTFSHQLLSFLGAPETPSSLPLQLRTLTRIRAASLLQSASSTMGSLACLTVALPSIAIPETVSSAVDRTLLHLRRTCDSLRNGEFSEALRNARIAESEAEKGFFEKSMVGQVYFPDEHKVAVYLPLLGPVAVPLIMSALKELKSMWNSFKGRRVRP